MLYLDTPTSRDLDSLNTLRADACVSIYLPTTPITQDIQQARITLSNLSKEAVRQLREAGTDKRRLAALQEYLDDLADDEEFWRFQAHSLAVFATPDSLRTYRLANRLSEMVEVSDRFHLKPLIRSITFPHAAYVLAISENAVRLVEISPDLPAAALKVPDLPTDAASAVYKSTVNERSPSGRLQGSEGQKTRLTQYARKVDAALRPFLAGSELPVILAATQPVEAIFRSVGSIQALPQAISGSHDRTSEADLATAARPILDAHYEKQIADFHALFDTRKGQSRATTDISDAARAATFGNIEQLLIDIDNVVNGSVDEETGMVTFDEAGDARNYGVVDEIASRALRSGAKVFGARKDDIPGRESLAAILRSPV
ncbi:hypothetical protein [Stenotrophomonas sp. MMGLT7]|uniref:baeRF11 domain-containing protein n=1 Tax=Stenotrophomonas sp. MMGLT7 TaxID=2901227 RepID=UPI001E3CD1F8|nr:hypothetical protein [Stenotrophomonas sp. MMGLT7]MCD7096887.1 hypothetical protein [Stenotrophomonas sp. MMGLT7]